jgi:SAM-dependent methyltransferase
LHGDAQELNGVLQDESFDLIVSLETIEHLRRPDEFLEGLRKCLKNDGDIIISCPNDWWYYPEITQHNQYHMRKYRFNEFLDCVVKLLGSPSSIYIGLPLTGFANIKLGMDKSVENIGIKQRDMVNVKELSNVLQVPLEEGTALSDNASYFVCHWGSGDVSSAAILPVPMDVFRNGLYAPNQLEARDSNMTTSNVETNESRKDHGEFEQRLNSNYFHIRTIASRLEIDTLKDRVRYLRDELDRNRAELEKLSHAKRTLQNSFFPPRLMLSILSVIRRLKRKVSHRIKK